MHSSQSDGEELKVERPLKAVNKNDKMNCEIKSR
jgi:hypothetical protein